MNASNPPDKPATQAEDMLGLSTQRRKHKGWLWGGLIALLIVIGIWLFTPTSQQAGLRYETAETKTGDLTVTVTATGTLQPTNQVDVGSELSGTIEAVMVDDNSRVKQGDVLARLDVSRLQDQIANARAALEVAEANVAQAQATQKEAAATLTRQQEMYRISNGKVPSKAELDAAEASLARAKANVTSAKASVTQARAVLRTNETNLSKATILSPIDGVVLSRQVEPGQTVAASLQAPTLFILAEDLAHMELQVMVDEADVGQVKEGQQAVFTVDAYPNREYPAHITRVSFGATTTDNVVTYLTILQVNNDDLSLRPGMTATAEITTTELHNVLLVPNAALRFTPPSTSNEPQQSLVSRLLPHRPRQEKTVRIDTKGNQRQVWTLRNGELTPITVKTGVTDGRFTEIVDGDLKPGMAVITETQPLKQ